AHLGAGEGDTDGSGAAGRVERADGRHRGGHGEAVAFNEESAGNVFPLVNNIVGDVHGPGNTTTRGFQAHATFRSFFGRRRIDRRDGTIDGGWGFAGRVHDHVGVETGE